MKAMTASRSPGSIGSMRREIASSECLRRFSPERLAEQQPAGTERYAEIKENDYNLNITRYVSLAQEEKPIDLQEVHDKLVEIEAEIVKARDKHNEFLKELGLPPLV
jgi:type I restriction-modification system DNA methylase subunit